jgi:hypothetical protein
MIRAVRQERRVSSSELRPAGSGERVALRFALSNFAYGILVLSHTTGHSLILFVASSHLLAPV